MGFGSILAGAKKLYELADMSDMDIIGKLPEELQKMFKDFTDAPGKLMDTVSEFFGDDPIGNLPTIETFTGQILGHSGVGAGGIGQGGLTQAGTLVEMGGIGPGFGTAGSTTAAATAYGGSMAVAPTAPFVATSAPASIAGSLMGASGMGAGGIGMGGLTSAGTLVEMGGMSGGATGVAGTGSILGVAGAAAALAGFAMFMRSRMAAKKDPTADARSANQLENYFQKAINESGEDRENTLKEIQKMIWNNPTVLNTIKIASSGGQLPFGAKHTSGGKKIIGWSSNISEFVNENMGILKEAFEWGEQKAPGAPGDPVRINPYSDLEARYQNQLQSMAPGDPMPIKYSVDDRGVVGSGVYIHPEAGG